MTRNGLGLNISSLVFMLLVVAFNGCSDEESPAERTVNKDSTADLGVDVESELDVSRDVEEDLADTASVWPPTSNGFPPAEDGFFRPVGTPNNRQLTRAAVPLIQHQCFLKEVFSAADHHRHRLGQTRLYDAAHDISRLRQSSEGTIRKRGIWSSQLTGPVVIALS